MAQPSVETLMGPCFLLIWLSFILYGLVLAQVYFYFTTYRDHLFVRLVVVLLCALETLHVAACMHMLYTYLIMGFSNPEILLKIIWSVALALYLEAIIGGIVHLHYIYRIWGLGRNIPVLGYLIVVTCACVVLELRSAAFLSTEDSWSSMIASSSYRREGSAALAIGLLADLSVTTAFLLTLNQNHSHARTRGTKSIVQKLMQATLSSGILTAVLSIITFILFVDNSLPKLHSGGTLALLSRVYANAMLAMLNRRQGIKRDAALNDAGFSLHLSNLPKEGLSSEHQTITKVQVIRDTITTGDLWSSEDVTKNGGSASNLAESRRK